MTDSCIGIAGNPNCGKTTLFNALTGARQYVGNWPGVTVDRVEGRYQHQGRTVRVVDLPGVYSLGAVAGTDSLDERVARDFVLSRESDVIVNIVDATNLERNLYLTAQLIEMGTPLVVALNMTDVAQDRQLEINTAALAEQLGCPVVELVASRRRGVETLLNAIDQALDEPKSPATNVPFPDTIEHAIEALKSVVEPTAKSAGIDDRWLALKLLEGDDRAQAIAGPAVCPEVAPLLDTWLPQIKAAHEDADIAIADARYTFANRIARHVAHQKGQVGRTLSDAIDQIVANRWLGPPIFLLVMYTMFMFTVNVGGAFIDFADQVVGAILVDGLGVLLSSLGAPDWLRVILADGVGGGIQVVATFVPIIGCLYLFLSVLEDSGYMARAAFVIDRFIRAIGLPGKSFVPLIVGFGCNVPSIMASRTLEKARDRIMTVAMAPFMSCGARLAVYAVFTAAFFPAGGQNIVFVLYIAGIVIALLTGLVLKHTLLRGEVSPFIMELPPYHVPVLKGVLIHAWNRLKSFIFGAGKIIVIVVTVLSFVNSWGTDGSFGNEGSEKSVLSAIGRAMVPVFTPLGITEDNWPATVGVFTGVFAKEAVVGTLDALYSNLAEQDARAATSEPTPEPPFDLWTALVDAAATIPPNLAQLGDLLSDPLGLGVAGVGADDAGNTKETVAAAQDVNAATFGAMEARFDGRIGAFAYLVFILLYTPCVAAMGAIQREVGNRWALFIILWTTGIAYVSSVAVYQVGVFERHPVTSLSWLGGIAIALALVIAALRHAGQQEPPVETIRESV